MLQEGQECCQLCWCCSWEMNSEWITWHHCQAEEKATKSVKPGEMETVENYPLFAQDFPDPGEVMPMEFWANRKISNISLFPVFQSSRYQKGQGRTCWTPERQEGSGKSKTRALPSSLDHKRIEHLTTLLPCCWSRGPESLGADSFLHESGVWLFWPQRLKQRDGILKPHRP